MSGAVLPEYGGLGLANVAPTVERHFGVATAIPPLSPDVLPPSLLDGAVRVITLLIDALGYEQLLAAMRAGHAPHLAALSWRDSANLAPITSTFPSTTVTALTTVGTGLPPGQHGVVSQKMYDPALGTVIDVLPFAPVFAGRNLESAGLEPADWVGLPTVYDRLRASGVGTTVVNHSQFEGTSLSRINHRGAEFIGFRTVSDLCTNLRAVIEAPNAPAYIHSYWGTLDAIAHAYGTDSPQHTAEIRVLDYALGEILLGGLRSPGTLLLIVADHGHVDTVEERTVLLNRHPDLLNLLFAPPAGLDRATLLYVRPGHEAEARAYAEHHLGECARILSAEESVEMGLYGPGPLPPRTVQRIGQLLILPVENWLFKYQYPRVERKEHGRIIGKHGGLSVQEMLVPLLAARLD